MSINFLKDQKTKIFVLVSYLVSSILPSIFKSLINQHWQLENSLAAAFLLITIVGIVLKIKISKWVIMIYSLIGTCLYAIYTLALIETNYGQFTMLLYSVFMCFFSAAIFSLLVWNKAYSDFFRSAQLTNNK
jgi:hypothetical protein